MDFPTIAPLLVAFGSIIIVILDRRRWAGDVSSVITPMVTELLAEQIKVTTSYKEEAERLTAENKELRQRIASLEHKNHTIRRELTELRAVVTYQERAEELIQTIVSSFSNEELDDVAFAVHYDGEPLTEKRPKTAAREIFTWSIRHGRLSDLIDELEKNRPNRQWRY